MHLSLPFASKHGQYVFSVVDIYSRNVLEETSGKKPSLETKCSRQ